MTRIVNVALGQLGPVQKADSRASVVRRLCAMMREAQRRGHTVFATEPRDISWQVGGKVVAQVRRDDFCLAVEEHELGVHAIAVPLRDVKGRTVAALNVIVPPGRLDDASLRADALERLRAAARSVTSRSRSQ